MPAKKIFVTGVTGYIGGDAFFALHQAHPDWDFSVLVRNEVKGKPVKEAFPKVELVYGNLDDYEVIKQAAAAADIVLHTADSSDHEGAARAIAAGLQSAHSSSNPGYWIHVSGTGILCWYDMDHKRYGQPPLDGQAYDDLEGVDRLLNLPDSAWHRNVDKIVLEAAGAAPDAVKVAVVCPPTIYGPGRGPLNQRSRQVPGLVNTTLKKGIGVKLGTGLTEWDNVHVWDLSSLFVLLSDAATSALGKSNTFDVEKEKEIWGPRAYFLAENGQHFWGELAKVIVKTAKAKRYLKTEDVIAMDTQEAMQDLGVQALTWGLNSKGRAKRARTFLGWEPKGESLEATIPDLIEHEAKSLGIQKIA